MSDPVIVQNIYYGLAEADKTPMARMKISYLLTAATLLESLILKEGIQGPIKVISPIYELVPNKDGKHLNLKEEDPKTYELNTTEDIINFIEKHIIGKLLWLASNTGVGLFDLTVPLLGYTPSNESITIEGIPLVFKKPDYFSKAINCIWVLHVLEATKSLLLKLLVALGLTNVRYTDLSQKLTQSSRI